jgi:D-sedoheptulose 7-phosphate isomerase
MGLFTIALTGPAEAPLAQASHLSVMVPTGNSQRIQEAHITIGHIVLDLLERELDSEGDQG